MASPREIVARWDARLAREQKQAQAKRLSANDNEPRKPDGYIWVGNEPIEVWLPVGVPVESMGLKTFQGIATNDLDKRAV